MKTRILSSLCMLPLLYIIYLGNGFLGTLLLIVLFISVFEFFNSFNKRNKELINMTDGEKIRKKNKKFVFYPLLVFISFLFINSIDSYFPKFSIFLIFVVSFSTDIFAYFGGMLLGKHKLAPKISPKKTIEGSVCGIIFSMITSSLFLIFLFNSAKDALSFNESLIIRNSILFGISFGLIGSIFAQLGDLLASYIKRQFNVKDFSNLIPGHGGVLDRIDSIIIVAPLCFLFFSFVFK